jgi:hypothetical protein
MLSPAHRISTSTTCTSRFDQHGLDDAYYLSLIDEYLPKPDDVQREATPSLEVMDAEAAAP